MKEEEKELIAVRRWDGNDGWGRTTVGQRRAFLAVFVVWFFAVFVFGFYKIIVG